MPDCQSIESFITPYVDGDINAAERRLVDDHVRRCPPCYSRVATERAVRELMCARRRELAGDTASSTLRGRCAALHRGAVVPVVPVAPVVPVVPVDGVAAAAAAGVRPAAWRARLLPLALAAGVVGVAGGALLYQVTGRSSELLAAELTADHVKCFGMNQLIGVNSDAAAAERTMSSTFGWHMPPSDAAARAGMELLGARGCLYGRGLAAHLMYRRNGKPVSVFMIPHARTSGTPDALVDVMGHEAAVWSGDGRTFVLVARKSDGSSEDMSRMTAVVQAAVH